MANKEIKEVVKYKGADLIVSAKYKPFRDVLTATLTPDRMYSVEEVDKIIDNFNKTKA